ncbi:hypothetical protein TSOC_000937, partial [Tetrabaena socialis]
SGGGGDCGGGGGGAAAGAPVAAVATGKVATPALAVTATAAATRRMTRAASSSAVASLAGPAEAVDDGGRPEAVGGCTEAELNGRGTQPRAARLLVVCSKYDTGYDDPRLGCMFLDRALSGARAVQVLGRLNRPAPGLGKGTALLGVVDFVNSAGQLREAFEEFIDVTHLHTGKHARRLRQERQLERALSRILEGLQPAADRAAALAAAASAAAAVAATGPGGRGGGAAATSSSPAGGGGGGLMAMGAGEMAAVAALHMAPEGRRALEADLGLYVSLAGSLRVEMAELPAAFASSLLA